MVDIRTEIAISALIRREGTELFFLPEQGFKHTDH